jgi:hypothetical protein
MTIRPLPHAPSAGLLALAISLALALSLPADASAQTILNTERFQLAEVDGPHLSATFSATGRRGNSEVFVADGSGIAGILSGSHWTRLIFGGSYLSDGDRSLLDSRFVQLRYSWIPTDRFQTFHFVQAQQNESLRLRSRWLVGSGVQHRILNSDQASFSVGTGAMLEWERLDADAVDPGDTTSRDAVRMANLGVLRYEAESGIRVLNIVYVQPRFDDFSDLRILNDLGVSFPVTERVRFTVSGEWRRDTRPPSNLERDDLVLRMGITLDFR